MSKKDTLIFIKYIYTCIDNYEQIATKNCNDSPIHKFFFDEYKMIDQFEYTHQQILQLLPNDIKAKSLVASELNFINDFYNINKDHKMQLIKHLRSINFNDSIDSIRNNLMDLVCQLRSKNKYSYQLSDIIYGCMLYELQ